MAAQNSSTRLTTNSTTSVPVVIRPTSAVVLSNTTTATSTVATTLLQSSTVTTAVSAISTTNPNTSIPGPLECPILSEGNTASNNNNSGQTAATTTSIRNNSTRNIYLSTTDRKAWTVVRAECVTRDGSRSVVYLQCQVTGQWNATLPACVDHLDVSSFKLYFAVAGVVCGLSLFVLLILFCYLLTSKRKRSSSSSTASSQESEKNIYVDPYFISEAIAKSTSSKDYARTGEITYAKPVVYSTYLNPSFYEDSYDRWRKHEESVSERLYDSPWAQPRGLKAQMDTPGFKWSQTSLRTLGESGFSKLPRPQLSTDHSSLKSHNTIGYSDGANLNDSLLNQSTTSSYILPLSLRRCPPMAAKDTRAEMLIDKSVTGFSQDDDSRSTLCEIDGESCVGLTNF